MTLLSAMFEFSCCGHRVRVTPDWVEVTKGDTQDTFMGRLVTVSTCHGSDHFLSVRHAKLITVVRLSETEMTELKTVPCPREVTSLAVLDWDELEYIVTRGRRVLHSSGALEASFTGDVRIVQSSGRGVSPHSYGVVEGDQYVIFGESFLDATSCVEVDPETMHFTGHLLTWTEGERTCVVSGLHKRTIRKEGFTMPVTFGEWHEIMVGEPAEALLLH